MAFWRTFLVFVVTVGAFIQPANTADRIIGAGFKSSSIELIDVLQVVDSTSPQVAIDVPVDSTGQKIRMTLQATTTAKLHRWAIFTLSNPDLIVRDFVLQIPRQNFIDSKVIWPKPNAARVITVNASTGPRPVLVGSQNAQNFALTLAAGGTTSFAIELSGVVLQKATLWHRQAFDAQAGQLAFFNGVVLGIAFLLGVAILSMFVVRPMAIFPSAGLFAWAMIGFMLLNAGVLSLVTSQKFEATYEPMIRSTVEGLMVVGLSISLITILQLIRNAPLANVFFWVATVVGLGLVGLGFVEPLIASGLARISFAVVAVSGWLTSLALWNRGVSRANASLIVWFIIVAWTLVASIGALGLVENGFIEPAIAAGQGLILITLSFTLVQLVFGQSIASNHFLEDSGRRALALAGSEQSVWDWQVSQKTLYVGPELERSLGIKSDVMGSINLRKWQELIHPSDRDTYFSTIEAAEKRGKGPFSKEFRLRRADGTYRWYLLRARAIASEDNIASRLIGTLTDVTAVKRSEERLLADAVRDRVTGLPNRALFIDRLERAMRRANAHGIGDLFVLVVDLDRFKNVNDGLGHEVGDSLLNVIGNRLGRMVGPDDTLARLAGDQFGIIFNGETPDREIGEVVDNIREIVALPINVRPREIFLTASIGVAKIELGHDDPEELVKNAEIALYEVKRNGKDQIGFFDASMRDDRSQLVALESDLRRALDRNEIEVVYQPIKRLVDDQLAGFEALVRWRHAKLGLLSPDAFMNIAEETGIIKEVGRYVLNEAARKLGIWQRAFRPSDPLFVAVNVSRAQLLNYELISDLRALLGREDIVPGTLKLEVTETMVMQNPELASKVLERATDLGVGIACDDFGTGYSALANLARLPFDTLKIDRAFLLEDGVTKNATVIFDAITDLAHNLNLNVVAEGVETEDQLERLRARGVDYAQGFYIGEPVSAQRVIEALGGQPYVPETPASGLTLLWDRLLGKKPALEDGNDGLPTPEEQAAEVAEMQRQDEMLEPWSPDRDDVSDPELIEVPEHNGFVENATVEEPITERPVVDEPLAVEEVVLPFPPVVEEKPPVAENKPLVVEEKPPVDEVVSETPKPKIGAAPLAPRVKSNPEMEIPTKATAEAEADVVIEHKPAEKTEAEAEQTTPQIKKRKPRQPKRTTLRKTTGLKRRRNALKRRKSRFTK